MGQAKPLYRSDSVELRPEEVLALEPQCCQGAQPPGLRPREQRRHVCSVRGQKARSHPLAWAVALGLWTSSIGAWAGVRFDVFLGYDGLVPQANWFPVVCEVHNDGPSFQAVVEVSSGQFGAGTRVRWPVELPTGTAKRFAIPVFNLGQWGGWRARLLDEHGRVRAETPNLSVRQLVDPRLPVVAALSRTPVTLPETRLKQSGLTPLVARLQLPLVPDNPLAWMGLDTLYLSSGQALELKVPQVNALLAWLHAGGRLVVSIEQLGHVTGTQWLRALLPCEVTGLEMVTNHQQLHQWLTNSLPAEGRLVASLLCFSATPGSSKGLPSAPLPNPYAKLQPDPAFESAPLQVASVRVADARVLAGSSTRPLMLGARRGRGELIVLLFSPELEPFRSWVHRPWFWARLAQFPVDLFRAEPNASLAQVWNRFSTDGVFGAVLETTQVRKLPIGWLVVLLVGYLMVIGPVDRWWLKKVRREVWTWVTFPAYVVLFSGLIYLIGYKLRAGVTEYNELHVVDLVPTGPQQAEWRGITYATIYSPVNATYRLVSDLPVASLRAEHAGSFASPQNAEPVRVLQRTAGFSAEAFVRVWTSEMVVSHWWHRAEPPLAVRIKPLGDGWEVWVQNLGPQPVTRMKVVLAKAVVDLGDVPAGQERTFRVARGQGTSVWAFVNSKMPALSQKVALRRRAFAMGETPLSLDPVEAVMTASLVGLGQSEDPYSGFVAPGGQDLTELLHRGDALVLAWMPNYGPVPALNRFPAPRSRRDTLWRCAVPLSSPATAPASG